MKLSIKLTLKIMDLLLSLYVLLCDTAGIPRQVQETFSISKIKRLYENKEYKRVVKRFNKKCWKE